MSRKPRQSPALVAVAVVLLAGISGATARPLEKGPAEKQPEAGRPIPGHPEAGRPPQGQPPQGQPRAGLPSEKQPPAGRPTEKQPVTVRPPDRGHGRAGWRLVWSDEFTGSAVDRSKWNVRDGEARDIDLGCNVDDPANVFVSGGVLTLRALRRTVACGKQTRAFTQVYLDTIGKASWTYGRFEIRAESPNGPNDSQGLWPAFWLRPDDLGRGEIDVTELPGGARWYDRATAAIFWDYTPVKQDVRLRLPGGGYPGDGFHTYATEWEPGALRWYFDGRLVWTRNRRTTPWFDAAFSRPYHLRLNFQVGGWLGNPTASTAFPADFRVDQVRVYQR